MRILVFGTGVFWKSRQESVLNNSDIICFLDNNPDKIGKYIHGILIDSPNNITKYENEYDYVLLMSQYTHEMKMQLVDLGITQEVIWTWKDYVCNEIKDAITYYVNENVSETDTIIITTAMNYNGGTIAAVYAAKALTQKGQTVIMCTQRCDIKYLDEIRNDRVNVLVAPILEFDINFEIMGLVQKSKNVIINVFQMLPIVSRLNGIKPILWWVHEPEELYGPVLGKYVEDANPINFEKINIKAVSRVAMANFNSHFPNRIDGIMTYGIPDEATDIDTTLMEKNSKITFAVIGGIIELKAQDVFVKAVSLLKEMERIQANFLVIGNDGGKFGQQVHKMAQGIDEIKFMGNLSRKQMREIYPSIDVVVCPSLEETMSIVMTEAMMHGKACIGSDKAGMTDYIIDGENGLVCKAGNAENLTEKIRYFINNPQEVIRMGKAARKIYEDYFTMDKFASRLIDALDETANNYNTNS